MKTKINKKLKTGLITILSMAILGVVYLIYNVIYNPGFKDEKVSLYTYKSIGDIKYTINLKPNNLYTGKTMGEGELYITEFIDHIKADLKYDFTSNEAANITVNYDIIIKVQGFTEEKEEEINIWEKDFPIVQNKQLTSNDNKLSIDEGLKIYLNEYNTFATEIIEASKIRSQARLILLMDINLQGSTEEGKFEDNISPSLIIPLGSPMFQIKGDSNITKPGGIEDTIQTKLPIDKSNIILYGTILGIFISALIILLFFTIGITEKDPIEKKIKKIFKKHGDRLVALNTDIENKNGKKVRTIEDLVRVADEIDKPILYKYNKEYKEINKFYVINENEIYILEIAESLSNMNEEQSEQLIEVR